MPHVIGGPRNDVIGGSTEMDEPPFCCVLLVAIRPGYLPLGASLSRPLVRGCSAAVVVARAGTRLALARAAHAVRPAESPGESASHAAATTG